MTSKTLFGYSAHALRYDARDGTFSMNPSFHQSSDRIEIEVMEDAAFDHEMGDEAGIGARAFDDAGNLIAQGTFYLERYAVLEGPDNRKIIVDRLDMGGGRMAFLPSAAIEIGVSYLYRGSDAPRRRAADPPPSMARYPEFRQFTAFAEGTQIETTRGPMPIEWLDDGEKIITRHHGAQPVIWVGYSSLSQSEIVASRSLRPISFRAVADYNPLIVAPRHRLFVESEQAVCRAQFLTEHDEAAAWPVEGGISYYHLMLPRHELILSEGRWSETLRASANVLKAFPKRERENYLEKFADQSPHALMPYSKLRGNRARAFVERAVPLVLTTEDQRDIA